MKSPLHEETRDCCVPSVSGRTTLRGVPEGYVNPSIRKRSFPHPANQPTLRLPCAERVRCRMRVAWRTDTMGANPGQAPAAESRTVLELVPKQRTMVDLVDRVAS